jgi:hypothetical protein
LLPVHADSVFCPVSELCPDCQGTGYIHDNTFDLCYCMTGQPQGYDFPRLTDAETRSMIGPWGWYPRPWQARVWWDRCPACTINPVKTGPYNNDGDVIRVPWAPDCTTCNDTGWAFYRPSSASPASHNTPASRPARSALYG